VTIEELLQVNPRENINFDKIDECLQDFTNEIEPRIFRIVNTSPIRRLISEVRSEFGKLIRKSAAVKWGAYSKKTSKEKKKLQSEVTEFIKDSKQFLHWVRSIFDFSITPQMLLYAADTVNHCHKCLLIIWDSSNCGQKEGSQQQ